LGPISTLRNLPHLAGLHLTEHLQQRRNEREKIWKSVGECAEHHEGDGTVVEPLLKGHILVDRDQNIELAGHGLKKPTVCQARPREIDDACHMAIVDAFGQPPRDAVVDQNPHCVSLLTLLGGSFAGLGDGGLPRHLQHGDGVFPGDVGKVVQELVKRVARLRCSRTGPGPARASP
jgi:hypothetical protein